MKYKILCFLGLHDWVYNSEHWQFRVCNKCKKEQKAKRCAASDMMIWRDI